MVRRSKISRLPDEPSPAALNADTTPDTTPAAAAPGASFTVQVTVDPGMKTGLELKKPVHVVLADGRAQSMQVVGRVKTVVKVRPDAIELSAPVDAKAPTVTLSRMDGAAFKVTGATPAGVIAMPTSDKPAKSFELRVDTKAWEKASRPTAITLTTDQADAPKVAVIIKAADSVAMFRLPASAGSVVDGLPVRDAAMDRCTARMARGDRAAYERLFMARCAFVESEAARRLGQRRAREMLVARDRAEAVAFLRDHELLEQIRRDAADIEGLSAEDRFLFELKVRTDATTARLAAWLGVGRAAVASKPRATPLPAYVRIMTSDAQVAAELELANACERIERAKGRVVVVECVVPPFAPAGDPVRGPLDGAAAESSTN